MRYLTIVNSDFSRGRDGSGSRHTPKTYIFLLTKMAVLCRDDRTVPSRGKGRKKAAPESEGQCTVLFRRWPELYRETVMGRAQPRRRSMTPIIQSFPKPTAHSPICAANYPIQRLP